MEIRKKLAAKIKSKTIKQIADELGINKQRVARYVKKNNIKAYDEDGANWYGESDVRLIMAHFKEIIASEELYRNPPRSALSINIDADVFERKMDELIGAVKELTAALVMFQPMAAVQISPVEGKRSKLFGSGKKEDVSYLEEPEEDDDGEGSELSRVVRKREDIRRMRMNKE